MNAISKNQDLALNVLDVLKALTRGNFFWQKKILDYKNLVDNIIALEHDLHNEKSFWILLFNISQHRGLQYTLFIVPFLITFYRSKAAATTESIRYCTNWNHGTQSLPVH